jgi:aromatic ring-cleaving dioxygenase
MTFLDVSAIESWHAHVYFDAPSKDAALQLREAITSHLGDSVTLGRFHEKPVGPHPKWSYQIAFAAEQLARVLAWLTLNHGALDVFLHPNTGDSLRDHRDAAVWIGHSHPLVLGVFSA